MPEHEDQLVTCLASFFEQAAAESLSVTGTYDIDRLLKAYLADAHALETQSVKLLSNAAKHEHDRLLADNYQGHLEETRLQRELIERRMDELGGTASMLKDQGLGLGALSWAAFFKIQPDTSGKLAAFAYAVEHLEIAGYEQFKYVAEFANDPPTVARAEQILRQERAVANKVGESLGHGALASLRARV